MKILYLALLAMCSVTLATAQSNAFTVTGDLSNLKAPVEWVYLVYTVNDQRITDSVLVKQDSYQFKGNITEPTQVGLRIRYKQNRASNSPIPYNSKRDYTIVFLEPGNITVASLDSFSNVVVTGSRADTEYRKLHELSKPFDSRLDDLYRQFAAAKKENNAAALKDLEAQIDSTDAAANEEVYGTYVKAHPASPLAMYALKNWAGYEIDAAKVEPVFKTLPLAARNTASGKAMQEKINIARKTGIGQLAMDFTQNDTLGNPVKLSSFKGKYLLLDFWASWCGPCRAENPNLVASFNKYKDKGFQVLSVSLDRPGAKDKWLKAIHDDGLGWAHVSDLQFWNNAVARQYGIEAIPQNLLLDPSGKIVGKNLRGAELDKKLATIYPN
jgi:peroxiredoxin